MRSFLTPAVIHMLPVGIHAGDEDLSKTILHRQIKLSPTQVLVLGFVIFILTGTLLLSLPAASADGLRLSLTDALFTATSAVCVTGLVVVDTGDHFSLFGQLVILVLIQAGGLGFMTMATMIFLLLGKRITLRERLIMQEALNQFTIEGVVRLTKNIIVVTFLIEAAGALIFSFRFVPLFGWGKGLYYSIFHSISAFCNAGFDLMGHYSSFTGFTGDPLVVGTLTALIVLGGLGFSVLLDIYSHRNPHRWSLHTKVVVSVSALLILSGFLFFVTVEWTNPETLGLYPWPVRILAALFQSVTARTAGFNTIDTGALSNASKFFLVLLMFVGASPASTGGGIKTTTAAMVLLMATAVIRGREENELFHRHVPMAITIRALAIALISLSALICVTMLLSLLEQVPFLDILFQSASALGTVGLSTMDIGGMHNASKIVVTIAMFMGRVGPLTLTLALAQRQSGTKPVLKHPEERVMVG